MSTNMLKGLLRSVGVGPAGELFRRYCQRLGVKKTDMERVAHASIVGGTRFSVRGSFRTIVGAEVWFHSSPEASDKHSVQVPSP